MHTSVDNEGLWQLYPMHGTRLAANVLLQDNSGPVCLSYQGNRQYLADGLRLEVQFQSIPDGIAATLRLHVITERHIAFVGLEIGPLLLNNGRRFFGTTSGFLDKQGVAPALTAQNEGRSAAMVAVVSDPSGLSLLAGISALNAEPSVFFLTNDRLRAGFTPDRRLTGECEFKLFFSLKPDPLELLQDYGRHLAPLGRCPADPPTGWNSWDFYGGAIRMEDLEGEMAALSELPFRDRLTYLTVDMGWEETWGNWIPNRKFPAELGEIARRIRAAGWRPGIWTAPFQVSMFTPLARYRPELFLRNAEGSLIIEEDSPCGPVLLLDCSTPEAQKLLGGWFSEMRAAGFELFKIDYLYEKYLRQSAHNAGGLGRIAFARRLFQTIRDAVGPDAHIINCGGSKEAALGLVESSRVTVDIHNFWGHIRNNARQLTHTFWTNRRLWINDPDFAIARHSGNCTARHMNMPYTRRPLTSPAEFWMRGPEASPEEIRLWLSLVRLNGGSIFLSDSIRALTSEGRADLGSLFPPLDAPFVPLDLFEREWPAIWLSQCRRRPTLGLFNWEDTAQTLPLPKSLAGELTGRDFWSGRPVRLNGSVELSPRSGLLMEL